MTGFDDMDIAGAANMLAACYTLLETGYAQAFTKPVRAELRALRDTVTTRLREHIDAITGPDELEAIWTRSGSLPPVEDDHLWPPRPLAGTSTSGLPAHHLWI